MALKILLHHIDLFYKLRYLYGTFDLKWFGQWQGCGVGSPVIQLRLLAISIIRLRPSAVLVT